MWFSILKDVWLFFNIMNVRVIFTEFSRKDFKNFSRVSVFFLHLYQNRNKLVTAQNYCDSFLTIEDQFKIENVAKLQILKKNYEMLTIKCKYPVGFSKRWNKNQTENFHAKSCFT